MWKTTGWVFSVATILTILAAPLSAQMVTEEWVADVPEFQWSSASAPKSVWTGSKFIVLATPTLPFSIDDPVTGRIYDPMTDTWESTPNLTTGYGAPKCGKFYTAVWTGTNLIVWGRTGFNKPNEGGIYDPNTDSWYRPANLQGTTGSPINRQSHVAAWTGTHMFVFGGNIDSSTGTPYSGYMYNPTSDIWESLPNLANAVGAPPLPTLQASKAVVWTGTRLIVVGKQQGASGYLVGGVYDPSTDVWESKPTLLSALGSPFAQSSDIVNAYWTGSSLLTWSGSVGSGGIYDPELDTWIPTTEFNGLSALPYRAAAWTGSKLLVWSDVNAANLGGTYDPGIDAWVSCPNLNSGTGAPAGDAGATTAWTGSQLIVWGGSQSLPGQASNIGGLYDPDADLWVSAPIFNAGWETPEARAMCSEIWTGSQVLVWGGLESAAGNGLLTGHTGRCFDRASKKWSTPPNLASGNGAPPARFQHGAVWTGSKMIVWGGTDIAQTNSFKNDGGVYNPATDTWEVAPNLNTGAGAPAARANPVVIWTGQKMFVYGGLMPANATKGGCYDPVTDTWESRPNLNNGIGAPFVGDNARGVLMGNKVFVWGKFYQSRGIYDLDTDTWESDSQYNAPGTPYPRYLHSAVWTGTDMIVWGGIALQPSNANQSSTGPQGGSTTNGEPPIVSMPTRTGRRYFPAQDTWKSGGGLETLPAIAPEERFNHTVIWTGNTGDSESENRMIVWGGNKGGLGGGVKINTGGVYNSSTNTWQPGTSSVGAPSKRENHSAIWTGSSMIIWGGFSGSSALGDGRAYNVITNSWSAPNNLSSGAYKPAAREGHTAIWTGTKMIIFGGHAGMITYGNGGVYDPSSDAWEDKANLNAGVGAPSCADRHIAIWTGTKMFVWGGHDINGNLTNTGGLYDPVLDQWESAPNLNSGIGAPAARAYHTAIWTGSKVIVWGGIVDDSNTFTNSGGTYDPVTDTWEQTPNLISGIGAPSPRRDHTMVWTGEKVIIWGGYDADEHSLSGGAYDPSTDAWETPTHLGLAADVPGNIIGQRLMSTGEKILVWGGTTSPIFGTAIPRGYLYNPDQDIWESKPTLNNNTCPVTFESGEINVVLAGTRMIVWGGENLPFSRAGAVYDLLTDSWLISQNLDTGVRSPTMRGSARSFWTGNEMIIWGGYIGKHLNTGGIYRYEVAYSAPVLSAIGNQSTYEGETLNFTASATDDDVGDVLAYSLDAAAVALGMTIDPNTGEFAWPVPLHTGLGGTTQYATITVTDSTFNTDSETIEIAIPLGTPVLAAIGSKSIEAGRTLTFTASATDPNPGDTLTYSLDAASVALGMKIDLNTGAFKWTPRLALAGTTVVVTITVTDGAGLTDSETFKIAVTKPPLVRAIKKP